MWRECDKKVREKGILIEVGHSVVPVWREETQLSCCETAIWGRVEIASLSCLLILETPLSPTAKAFLSLPTIKWTNRPHTLDLNLLHLDKKV
jgi:hypothetical protein